MIAILLAFFAGHGEAFADSPVLPMLESCSATAVSAQSSSGASLSVRALSNGFACGVMSSVDQSRMLGCQIKFLEGFFVQGFGGDIRALRAAAGMAASAMTPRNIIIGSALLNPATLPVALGYVATRPKTREFMAHWGGEAANVARFLLKLSTDPAFKMQMAMEMMLMTEQLFKNAVGGVAGMSCSQMADFACVIGGQIAYELLPILVAAALTAEVGGAAGWAKLAQAIAKMSARFPRLLRAYESAIDGIRVARWYTQRGLRAFSGTPAERAALAEALERTGQFADYERLLTRIKATNLSDDAASALTKEVHETLARAGRGDTLNIDAMISQLDGMNPTDARNHAIKISQVLDDIDKKAGATFKDRVRAWIDGLKRDGKVTDGDARTLGTCLVPGFSSAVISFFPKAYANPDCARVVARIGDISDDLSTNLRNRLRGRELTSSQDAYIRSQNRAASGRLSDSQVDRMLSNLEGTKPSGRGTLEGPRSRLGPNQSPSSRTAMELENTSADALKKLGYEVVQNPGDLINDSKIPYARRKELQEMFGRAHGRDQLRSTTNKPDLMVEGNIVDIFSPGRLDPKGAFDVIAGKVSHEQTGRVLLNLTDIRNPTSEYLRLLKQELIRGAGDPFSADTMRKLHEVMALVSGPGGPQVIHIWP